MNIEMIEALVVGLDEVLVIRVDAAAFSDTERLDEFAQALEKTPLKGRFVVFSGEVEFTKVKV